VPRERIQHTDVTQGPISRKFRIAELVINTAGNHNYLIKVEGLNVERANEMRLALLPRVKQHTKLEEPVQPEEPAKPGVPS
jgi:membrane protein YdbS with pleckstrin-like domain